MYKKLLPLIFVFSCNDTDANLRFDKDAGSDAGASCDLTELFEAIDELKNGCREACEQACPEPVGRVEPGEQCTPGVTECTPGFFCYPAKRWASVCTTLCDSSDDCPDGMRCNPKGLCRTTCKRDHEHNGDCE